MMKFMGEPVTQEEIDVSVPVFLNFFWYKEYISRIFWMRLTRTRMV